MNQNFQECTCISLSGVYGLKSNRVPATSMESGTSGVKDRVPSVSNSIRDHLYREPEEQLVQ
jgi:hypothetical protein